MDISAVERVLRDNIDGFSGPVTAEKTASGQSNPTYILSTQGKKYVLRSKPLGDLLKSAHAVDREFRVLSALSKQGLPVPHPYFLSEDLSVTGTMFYVMDFSEGRNFNDPRLNDKSAADRLVIYDAMNAGLVAIHSVDLAAAGLQDYGKAGNYFERQLSRWTGQYRTSETETIASMDNLINWLTENLPPDDGVVTLVHGDWRIDNLLFDTKTNALTAILDWELSTLGHPLADLGSQLMQWAMPVGPDGRGLAGVDRAALGIPSDAEYIAQYAQRRGMSASPDMRFYIAFSFFRMAAILQGVKKRALDGNASNPEKGLKLGTYVGFCAQSGLDTANEGS
ncbi:MAG: phosphotransferase family protein [Rhodobacteraceae bacterium]|nr:phosphotransferase family protein [Paracoccaceae bacterium]